MKELILKDFRLLKFISLVTVSICLMGGYIGVSLDSVIKTKLVYVFIVLLTSYLASMMIGQKEIKTNSAMIINSLPINRSLIVKSKYIFSFIYALLSALLVFFSSNVLGSIFSTNTPGVRMSLFDILVIVALTLVFYSIYLFLYYFNIGKAQLFNQVFYGLLILSPSLLNRFGENIFNSSLFKYLITLDFNSLIYLFVIIGLILYMVSLNISIKIYQGKSI